MRLPSITASPASDVGAAPIDHRFAIRGPVTLADYQALQKTLRADVVVKVWAWLGPLGFVYVGGLVGLLAWLAPLVTGGTPSDDALGWLTGGGMLLGVAAAVVFGSLVVAAMYRGQPISAGDQTLIADDAGLDAEVGGVRTVAPWSGIERVVETRDQVFLYFARYMAFIVPKASLAGADEVKRFLAFVADRTTGDCRVETLR